MPSREAIIFYYSTKKGQRLSLSLSAVFNPYKKDRFLLHELADQRILSVDTIAETVSGTNVSPLLSIITVVYNGVDGLEKTIGSVQRLKSPEIEYIVIDGGSTDGTVNLLQKHTDSIDLWISEPDEGIYDAINKGINASTGLFFYVLNVGDTLAELPLRELNDCIERGADVALFNVLLSDGRIIDSKIDYRIRFGNPVHHQGAFYKRGLNISYDLSFKVFSDFNTNQLLFKQGIKFARYNKVISHHTLDGISNNRAYRNEYYKVIRRNFGIFWMLVGICYLKQGNLRRKIRKTLRFKKF